MSQNAVEMARVLLVTREMSLLRTASSLGDANDWQFQTLASGWEAMERVQTDALPQALVLDLPLGDTDSFHVLRWLHRLHPELPIVMICHAEDANHQSEAVRLGAKEVLVRPITEECLESSLLKHLNIKDRDAQGERSRDDFELSLEDEPFLSASPAMRRLRVQAELLAQADVPVLVFGEPGSGKATIARLIHKLSVHSGFDFQRVNCANVPAHLLQAKVFGKTVPVGDRHESADPGTLLIEEITAMPADLQTRLVQLLQEKQTSRHMRIIATSSVKLEIALANKRIREDLYYRLSAFTLHVPPLRQRKEEIPDLLQYSMHKVARYYGKPFREFSSTVLASCVDYAWPGNLVELEAFVKRYLVAGETVPVNSDRNKDTSAKNAIIFDPQPLKSNFAIYQDNDTKASEPVTQSLKTLMQAVKFETEKNAIAAALEKTRWNRKAASRLLKVSYRTLLYKIEQYHMSAGEVYLSPLIENRMSTLMNETKPTGKVS